MAHTQVLCQAGLLKAEGCLRLNRIFPVPLSDFYEGVLIDDHLGVQLQDPRKKGASGDPPRVVKVFEETRFLTRRPGSRGKSRNAKDYCHSLVNGEAHREGTLA